jgi:hypothetical protein
VSFVPPCRRPENDPDDWFIGRDGKQYSDDELLGVEGRARAAGEALQLAPDGLNVAKYLIIAEKAIADAETEAVKQALAKRRHARDKCHVECILRLQCLDAGLEPDNMAHGIWGGYFPEERRQIVKLRDERERRRRKVPTQE